MFAELRFIVFGVLGTALSFTFAVSDILTGMYYTAGDKLIFGFFLSYVFVYHVYSDYRKEQVK